MSVQAGDVESNPAKRLGYAMSAQALACDLHNQATEFSGPIKETEDAQSKRRFVEANECVETALRKIRLRYKFVYAESGEYKDKVESLYATWLMWIEAMRSYSPSTRKDVLQRDFEKQFAALRADIDKR